jgi:hypothetical protein
MIVPTAISSALLVEYFTHDSSDLFSSPRALQAFSQFRIVVSFGQFLEQSSGPFAGPLV